MGSLSQHNPAAVTVYFLTVAGIAMFTMDPILLSLSLIGAAALFFTRTRHRSTANGWPILLFLAVALAGPILSHNGVTVLFVINRSPITLEAILYGVVLGGMILAVLYWFRCFSGIMTADKLLYIFGALSPKTALVLSMALRTVPLFRRQAGQINRAQRAMGLYREDNVVDTFRGGMRVFSILLTWGLENGIVTADSMAARGYGIGRRTHFSIFRFRRRDGALILVCLALAAITLWGIRTVTVTYYPAFTLRGFSLVSAAGYAAYGVLSLLPTLLEAKEALKWHCLRSKI